MACRHPSPLYSVHTDVSAPLRKRGPMVLFQTALHLPSSHFYGPCNQRPVNSPISEQGPCPSPSGSAGRCTPIFPSTAVLKPQVVLHPFPKADLAKMQHFQKPRVQGQDKCSPPNVSNAPVQHWQTGTINPNAGLASSPETHGHIPALPLHISTAPHAPFLTHHGTKPPDISLPYYTPWRSLSLQKGFFPLVPHGVWAGGAQSLLRTCQPYTSPHPASNTATERQTKIPFHFV